jgi:FkbM family methyltransferase
VIYLINQLFIFIYKVKYKLHIRNYQLYSFKRILGKNFKQNKEFSFIQIGANDGISFDDLFDFVTKRKSYGVLLEPVKSYFEELKINYSVCPKVVPVNMAVFHKKDVLDIYKVDPSKSSYYPDWAKGIASFDKDHYKKLNIKKEHIIIEKVEADHLMNIIDANFKEDYSNLDLFQVDTEGFDYDVIKMIDFKKMRPKIIKFEFVNLEVLKRQQLNKFLQDEGYILFNEGEDTIALDLKKVFLK